MAAALPSQGVVLITGVSRFGSPPTSSGIPPPKTLLTLTYCLIIQSRFSLTLRSIPSIQAAGGIGGETGLAFAEAGARAVVFADPNEAGAPESAAQSKSLATNPEYRALAIRVDVRDEASLQEMVDSTVKEFGRTNYSVNSAGMGVICTSTRTLSHDDPIQVHHGTVGMEWGHVLGDIRIPDFWEYYLSGSNSSLLLN